VVRTTVVGSWWLHPENEQSLRDYHSGRLSSEQGEAVLRRAATTAIKEQRDLGLDEWTGGEYFTHDFVTHLHHCLTGIEVTKVGAAELFDYDDGTEARIVGKIEAPDGLGYLTAYRRERNLPGGVLKAAVARVWAPSGSRHSGATRQS